MCLQCVPSLQWSAREQAGKRASERHELGHAHLDTRRGEHSLAHWLSRTHTRTHMSTHTRNHRRASSQALVHTDSGGDACLRAQTTARIARCCIMKLMCLLLVRAYTHVAVSKVCIWFCLLASSREWWRAHNAPGFERPNEARIEFATTTTMAYKPSARWAECERVVIAVLRASVVRLMRQQQRQQRQSQRTKPV